MSNQMFSLEKLIGYHVILKNLILQFIALYLWQILYLSYVLNSSENMGGDFLQAIVFWACPVWQRNGCGSCLR